MIGIYKIINTVNNKCYIGQSIDIYQRWAEHKSALNHNRHHAQGLQNAWNKYGENVFEFQVIEECDVKDLIDKEMYYIQYFDSYYNGYNGSKGGEYGLSYKFLSDEEKIIRRNELSLAHLNETIPIVSININTKEVIHWQSARIASKILDISQSTIWQCLNKIRYTYKNYIWLYEKEYNDKGCDIKWFIQRKGRPLKICQYDLNGNYIATYTSISEASMMVFGNKDSISSIVKCCKGKYRQIGGYVWRYENDAFDKYQFDIPKHIIAYDINGNKIKEYNSVIEASQDTGVHRSTIFKHCNGKIKMGRSVTWRYEGDDFYR